jgi:ATP-dependent Clp protease ATP-binding subunit ClpA
MTLQPQQTPRCRNVIAGAERLATALGHSYIGVEHLFLAMLEERDAVPTQVLARFCDLTSVEAGLGEVMRSPAYRGEPPTEAVWVGRDELPGLLSVLPDCIDPAARLGFNVVGDRAWITVSAPGDAATAVAAARARLSAE